MSKKVFIILVISLIFTPVFAGAVSDSGNSVSVSIFAKSDSSSWSKEITMNVGQNFDFLAVAKNNSGYPLMNVTLEVDFPKDVLSNGVVNINGKKSEKNLEGGLNIGAFLPGEEKAISFQAKSVTLNSKQQNGEILATVSSQNGESSDSIKTSLNPYSFQIARTAKKASLATVSFSVKQWYVWLIFIVALAIYLFRVFLRLFSTPMS